MQTRVRELMRPDVETIEASESMLAGARRMRDLGRFVLPVTDDAGHLVGLLTPRAVVAAVADGVDLESTTVADLTEPCETLDAGAPVEAAAEAFQRHSGSELPVSEAGKLVGMVRRRALESYGTALTIVGEQAPDLVRDVAPRDEMFEVSAADYYLVGAGALASIREALLLADRQSVANVLDFGCGHGRVMRMLKTAFPEAKLTACDIERDAVDFCARTFGAVPVYSNEDPAQIELEGEFDLIWSGSLLTHVDRDRWEQLLSLFDAVLAPGGVLVFSAHGRRSAEMIRDGTTYGLEPPALNSLLSDYEREGFGYHNYPHSDSYGISLAAPSWMVAQLERVPRLRLLMVKEAGWSNHQDIVACTRASG